MQQAIPSNEFIRLLIPLKSERLNVTMKPTPIKVHLNSGETFLVEKNQLDMGDWGVTIITDAFSKETEGHIIKLQVPWVSILYIETLISSPVS